MQHFIKETLPLILFGLSGIVFMIFTKVNDLNHKPENDALNFRQTLKKFFRKEWASYGASVTLVFIAAFSHDEWLLWFTTGKLSTIIEVPLGIKLAMACFGAMGHYLLYKFWLGKLDKQ